MAEVSGASTFGSLVALTASELALLAQYEGGYTQKTIVVEDLTTGAQVVAVTFIKNNVSFKSPPSEGYLTAIHMHLKENFPGDPCTITLRRVAAAAEAKVEGGGGGGDVVELIQAEDWSLPAIEDCDMLSFLVRVNNDADKRTKWQAPRELQDFKTKLAAISINTVGQLRSYMHLVSDAQLNQALLSRGGKGFSANSCVVMRKLLGL